MGSKKDSILLKKVKGDGEKSFPIAQALEVMLYQENKGLKDWKVSEPNYTFKNGEIIYTGGNSSTKKSKKSE